ncbi:MAG: DUF3899 domain-containing protein [Clostridia bacterium]|nr:DUF3899 domain-containing protein [Clostridia bacterium]
MREGKSSLIKNLIGTAVCVLLGAAMVLIYLKGHWYELAKTEAERYRLLCDGFSIAGIVLVCVSALILVHNTGLFTGLTYGLRGVKDIFLPFLQQKYIPYREYRKRKMEKKVKGYGFIFFTGLAFLAVAIFFMIRFHKVYVPEPSAGEEALALALIASIACI